MAYKPGFVPARLTARWMAIPLGCTSLCTSSNRPERQCGNALSGRTGWSFLFGFAPGGVCPAAVITNGAVRSYRTISPLPEQVPAVCFCGTFPGVAPAGRYPAPCFRGARTFLDPRGPRPSSHLARRENGPMCRLGQARAFAKATSTAARIVAVSLSRTRVTFAGR